MPKIRVMVIEDSLVIRRMIGEALNSDPSIEVAGVACNGKVALHKLPHLKPDLVTLDVGMPVMDGIATLRKIRAEYPSLPVIMVSALTESGAATTLEALELGANDYATTPHSEEPFQSAVEKLRNELVPKVKTLCPYIRADEEPGEQTRHFYKLRPIPVPSRKRVQPIELLCIGTSTGGPNALADLFKTFPAQFPIPIVIVQHMPPKFTALLADRLTHGSKLQFHEGREGQLLEPGHAYIAPGGLHMEVQRSRLSSTIHLHDGPYENSCRPAVDVLFRSVADQFGGSALGVILTGMGQDGLEGCKYLRQETAQIIVQDESTSVVWGMPGSVTRSGLADAILPLNKITAEIIRRVNQSRLAKAKA